MLAAVLANMDAVPLRGPGFWRLSAVTVIVEPRSGAFPVRPRLSADELREPQRGVEVGDWKWALL